MATYRIVNQSLTVLEGEDAPYNNETYDPGDEIELDPDDDRDSQILESYGDNLAEVEAEQSDAEAEREDSGGTGEEFEEMTDLDGVGETRAEDLRDAGYDSIEDLREANQADLAAVDGVSEGLAEQIKAQLN